MSNIFKGPPKPDMTEQKKMMLEQSNRLKEQKAEIEARRAAKRQGQGGRSSLISGRETGIPSGGIPNRTTLG